LRSDNRGRYRRTFKGKRVEVARNGQVNVFTRRGRSEEFAPRFDVTKGTILEMPAVRIWLGDVAIARGSLRLPARIGWAY